MLVKISSQVALDSGRRGCLNPFPIGFLEFKMSNSRSIVLINLIVPLAFGNFFLYSGEEAKNSMASATEELSVCAANCTFILCFVNFKYFVENLFAMINPSFNCIEFNS